MTAKTFKREIASGALALLFGLAAFAMAGIDPAVIQARAGVVAALAYPVLLFVGAAFGLDWAGKQWSGRSPDQFGDAAKMAPPGYPADIAAPETGEGET